MSNVKKHLKNLYLRYTLANELYMVELWEQIVVHLVILTLFLSFWYFNYHFIVSSLDQVKMQTPSSPHIEAM